MHLIRIATFLVVVVAAAFCVQAGQYEFMTLDVPGAIFTEPYGINNLGQVVGSYRDATGDHGFLFDGSSFREIRVLGATVTNPRDINDLGQIVGYTGGLFDPQRGFVLAGDSVNYLDYPGATSTRADGLNNLGDVVGSYLTFEVRGFLFDGSTYASIAVPGARGSTATAINDHGVVVGDYSEGLTSRGFSMTGGAISPLMLGGPASDITSTGRIVGTEVYSDLGNLAGFVLPGSSLLIDTIQFPGATNTIVEGTNDSGLLVGRYRDGSGSNHGFIARPIPEPTTLLTVLLVLFGTSCVGCYRRFFPRSQKEEK